MGKKDIISKQCFQTIAWEVATYLFGLLIDKDQIDLLNTESLRIEDRHTDLLYYAILKANQLKM